MGIKGDVKLSSEEYCMYLRKSRTDIEAEARGEGETLARHEKLLLEVAKRKKISVTEIYREIVSGDTIAARPVMQQVLQEVQAGRWKGVLVVDVDRLARGDTIDQGIVAQTFKFSNTLIITPLKDYDPNNEYDEEYFEFGLFMSRREYKVIKRRLQRGREASVKEGKYVGNKPPYGYKRVRLNSEKGWTLEPIPEEAEVIRLIFDLYTVGELKKDGTNKRLGISLIARRLNALKCQTRTGGEWTSATVRDILINPVYIGKVRWNWRPAVKKMIEGKTVVSRPRTAAEKCIVVDGLHPAIVDVGVWETAQANIEKNPPRPIGDRNTVKNPLAGLVVCGMCWHKMVRRPYPGDYPASLICAVQSCKNVSSALDLVEQRVIDALSDWLGDYRLKFDGTDKQTDGEKAVDMKQTALKHTDTVLADLEKRKNGIYDFLERGIYTTEEFLHRSRLISERIEQVKEERAALEKELSVEISAEKSRKEIIPKVERLLEVYQSLPTPKAKNDMLKEVLEKVVYKKENGGRWHYEPDDFELVLYPKLPPHDSFESKDD